MDQWAREFGQVFSEQNRAQFPANRDLLTTRSEKLSALIDESLRLLNEAAEKYEEASQLMNTEQDKRAISLIAYSLKSEIEMKQLFKAQAQLASDRSLTDAKAFNEKFLQLRGLIQQKQKEKDQQFDKGRRLLLRR
jgi:hypothetical protein